MSRRQADGSAGDGCLILSLVSLAALLTMVVFVAQVLMAS